MGALDGAGVRDGDANDDTVVTGSVEAGSGAVDTVVTGDAAAGVGNVEATVTWSASAVMSSVKSSLVFDGRRERRDACRGAGGGNSGAGDDDTVVTWSVGAGSGGVDTLVAVDVAAGVGNVEAAVTWSGVAVESSVASGLGQASGTVDVVDVLAAASDRGVAGGSSGRRSRRRRGAWSIATTVGVGDHGRGLVWRWRPVGRPRALPLLPRPLPTLG